MTEAANEICAHTEDQAASSAHFQASPAPCCPQEVFDNILERRIEWPDDISPECRDLIDCLLCSDPGQRLGARGAGEVRSLSCRIHFKHAESGFLSPVMSPTLPDSVNRMPGTHAGLKLPLCTVMLFYFEFEHALSCT